MVRAYRFCPTKVITASHPLLPGDQQTSSIASKFHVLGGASNASAQARAYELAPLTPGCELLLLTSDSLATVRYGYGRPRHSDGQ